MAAPHRLIIKFTRLLLQLVVAHVEGIAAQAVVSSAHLSIIVDAGAKLIQHSIIMLLIVVGCGSVAADGGASCILSKYVTGTKSTLNTALLIFESVQTAFTFAASVADATEGTTSSEPATIHRVVRVGRVCIARCSTGATSIELVRASVLLLVVCVLLVRLMEARASRAEHLLVIVLWRPVVILQRRRALAILTERRLTSVQRSRLIARISLRQLLLLTVGRHVEVVGGDRELLHVGGAGQVVRVVNLVPLLALVVHEAERMLTLLAQLLSHGGMVFLRLGQRVVLERIGLTTCRLSASWVVTRLSRHALVQRRVHLVLMVRLLLVVLLHTVSAGVLARLGRHIL